MDIPILKIPSSYAVSDVWLVRNVEEGSFLTLFLATCCHSEFHSSSYNTCVTHTRMPLFIDLIAMHINSYSIIITEKHSNDVQYKGTVTGSGAPVTVKLLSRGGAEGKRDKQNY